MRGADDEPERPGAAEKVRVGGRLLVPLVVAGVAVVVLGTAVEGPARFTTISFGGSQDEPIAPGPEQTAAAPPAPSQQLDATISTTVQVIVQVLAALIAVVVAVVLIRLIVRAVRGRRRRVGARRLRSLGGDTEAEVADAPTVLRGIAAALAAFDEHREPTDAVVRAWLGLQQAAEDAGLARSPAETPTEFTGRVLTRRGADRAAVGALLRLYLRARFDDTAITGSDADAAREALRALEASWERVVA